MPYSMNWDYVVVSERLFFFMILTFLPRPFLKKEKMWFLSKKNQFLTVIPLVVNIK